MTDWFSILNSAQKEAVESIDGPHLVVAGAGTGKTRVLEYRTLQLINQGINPASILLLTFTRRAAYEMLARASSHDPRSARVSGGTFHSFALNILKREGKLLGFDSFSVLDRGDSEDLVASVIHNLQLTKKHFPKKSTVADILSKAVNKEISIISVLEKDYLHLCEWEKLLELVKIKFGQKKAALKVMDYDDLLYFLTYLLERFEDIRRKISNTYRYIMIDEYQDTNKLQARIVHSLAKDHKNVLIVGDEMQSIYAFRGANFENMIDFPKIFPQSRKILLEENYRSTQEILDVANATLDEVQGPHFKKYLRSPRHGQKPIYCQFLSHREEATYVADEILRLLRKGMPLRNIAVLFRAAYQSAPLELKLASYGIPFKKFGGIKFIETAHVKDVLAHLRVIQNPKDELSWRRILLLIPGIGEKGADAIVYRIFASKSYDALLGFNSTDELVALLRLIADKKTSALQKLNQVIVYYKPILRVAYDDYPQREQDLSALVDIAASYTSVSDMLDDFALEPPERSADHYNQNPKDDWVCLSTIHSAKGLEWEVVFIIGVSDGKFPIIHAISNNVDVEEERRLFYVAVTRPKNKLYITAGSGGGGYGYFGLRYQRRISSFVEPLVNRDLVEVYGMRKRWSLDDSPRKNLYDELIDEF